jgi:hypothetical protein
MSSRLRPFLDRFGKIFQNDFYKPGVILQEFFLGEVERKRVALPEFRRTIVFSWHQYKKKQSKAQHKIEFLKFFRHKFEAFFSNFILRLFPFDANRLHFINSSNVISDEIIFEFHYDITAQEYTDVAEFRTKIDYPEKPERILCYIFSYLTSTFNVLIHQFIDADVIISQAGGTVRGSAPALRLEFLISIRQNREVLLDKYFQAELYHLADSFSFISQEEKASLHHSIDELYELAIEEYPKAEHSLAGVLYHFYKRCTTLQIITPLLDLITFVGSRVEDSRHSISNMFEQEFLPKFGFSVEKTDTISRIWHFLESAATLFSTWQSNNKPEPTKQVELFLLYCQYYFQRGVQGLSETNQVVFFPELFKKQFDVATSSGSITEGTSVRLVQFTLVLYSIVRNPASFRFIELILRRSPSSLNESFFDAFTKELNIQLYSRISQENIKLRPRGEKISFTLLVDLICRYIFYLIKTFFLRGTPEEASKNFIDGVSRYSGPRIALSVLEMMLFRELPLSDHLWGAYLLSMRQDEVKQVFHQMNVNVPESSFFNLRRIARLSMIAAGLTEKIPTLSEWLVTDIITPFSKFEKMIGAPFQFDGKPETFARIQKYFVDQARDPEEQQIFMDILLTLEAIWSSMTSP